MTIDREHVLAKLREQREHIEREYGLRMIGIVGSVARGEATEESDIDVIVDVIGAPSLFRHAGAERELQDAVGVGLPVELVFREGMRPSDAGSHRARSRSALMNELDREWLERHARLCRDGSSHSRIRDAAELAADERRSSRSRMPSRSSARRANSCRRRAGRPSRHALDARSSACGTAWSMDIEAIRAEILVTTVRDDLPPLIATLRRALEEERNERQPHRLPLSRRRRALHPGAARAVASGDEPAGQPASAWSAWRSPC